VADDKVLGEAPATRLAHEDLEHTDDDTLAWQAQHDPEAFGQLYRRHLERVYRYLLVRLRDTQLAQDLTAQTFLAALEGISGYRGEGAFAAWLISIARNKAMESIRRRQASVPLEIAAPVASADPSPERIIAARLRLEQVARALRMVAPERAEALVLRVFGGLSVAEVGAVMGKSEAAVKMLISRAVRDLRERLGPDAEEVDP
jgi:RNA polymerase sigma-70 factor (ECF subfamily)